VNIVSLQNTKYIDFEADYNVIGLLRRHVCRPEPS